MHASQGRLSVVVLLVIASFTEVRSFMRCSQNSDCIYNGCDGCCRTITRRGLGYCFSTCGQALRINCCGTKSYITSECHSACLADPVEGLVIGAQVSCGPERPCPSGTFTSNELQVCNSGGIGRGGGEQCSCIACPAGKSSVHLHSCFTRTLLVLFLVCVCVCAGLLDW